MVAWCNAISIHVWICMQPWKCCNMIFSWWKLTSEQLKKFIWTTKAEKGGVGRTGAKSVGGWHPPSKMEIKQWKFKRKTKAGRKRGRGRGGERERNLSQIFQLALDNIPGKGNNRLSFIKTLNFPWQNTVQSMIASSKYSKLDMDYEHTILCHRLCHLLAGSVY